MVPEQSADWKPTTCFAGKIAWFKLRGCGLVSHPAGNSASKHQRQKIYFDSEAILFLANGTAYAAGGL